MSETCTSGTTGTSEATVTGETTVISCGECVLEGSPACDDCVVTFLCNREPDDAVVVDVAEVRALRTLADAGLVPALRHRRRTG
jgi:hypothetical protein